MMEHQPNEVMALLGEAARNPAGDELMRRTREATDKEFHALITKNGVSVLAGG
jgi:hypothetical protein